MKYLKLWTSFRETITPLNDAEKGRLLDAMLIYADSGKQPDFKGNERFVWPSAKQAIDRAAQKAETLRQNGNKGGRPSKPNETKENQSEPNETKENQSEKTESYLFDKEKENEKKDVVVVVDNAHAHEDGPFGITGEDIQASIDLDSRIEDAARSVGLQVTEAGMIRGRSLAAQYGIETLLTAIPLAVDRPTWAYVEGILRKGVDTNGNRGNRSKPDGEIRSAYDFLRSEAL